MITMDNWRAELPAAIAQAFPGNWRVPEEEPECDDPHVRGLTEIPGTGFALGYRVGHTRIGWVSHPILLKRVYPSVIRTYTSLGYLSQWVELGLPLAVKLAAMLERS